MVAFACRNGSNNTTMCMSVTGCIRSASYQSFGIASAISQTILRQPGVPDSNAVTNIIQATSVFSNLNTLVILHDVTFVANATVSRRIFAKF